MLSREALEAKLVVAAMRRNLRVLLAPDTDQGFVFCKAKDKEEQEEEAEEHEEDEKEANGLLNGGSDDEDLSAALKLSRAHDTVSVEQGMQEHETLADDEETPASATDKPATRNGASLSDDADGDEAKAEIIRERMLGEGQEGQEGQECEDVADDSDTKVDKIRASVFEECKQS